MHTAMLYTAGAFAAGLALTWSLCAWLTPHSWWRRPNLRALGLSAVGAWGFGSLILAALPALTLPVMALPAMPLSGLALPLAALPVAAAPVSVAPVPVLPVAAASTARQRAGSTATTSVMAAGPLSARRGAETGVREPDRPFQVHRDLNLRASAGVDAPRLLTVPAGATVLATGQRRGDWWQVTASVNGLQSTGWASSLWLRRGDEPARPK